MISVLRELLVGLRDRDVYEKPHMPCDVSTCCVADCLGLCERGPFCLGGRYQRKLHRSDVGEGSQKGRGVWHLDHWRSVPGSRMARTEAWRGEREREVSWV